LGFRQSRYSLLVAIALIPFPGSAQTYKVKSGQREIYRFDYSNTTRSDMRSMFGLDTSGSSSPLAHFIETSVKGELVRTAVRMQADDWLFVYSFRRPSVKLRVNGQDQESSAATIAADLAKEMVLTIGVGGQIKTIRFDSTVADISKSFVRSMLASTQFVVTGANGAATWRTTEADPAGQYLAIYDRMATGRYARSKVQYTSQDRSKQGDIAAKQRIDPHGELVAEIDTKTGRLKSLAGVDSQRVFIGERIVASGTTRLAMRLDNVETTTSRLPVLGAEEDLFDAEAETAGERSLQRTELGYATKDSLLLVLAFRERHREDTTSLTPLYLKLKALIYLHPDVSTELGEILAKAPPNGPTMSLLSSALAAVGSIEAQDALIAAIKSRHNSWPALATLIPTLGGVRSPSQRAMETITYLAFNSNVREIESTARLAAGVMARNSGSPVMVQTLIMGVSSVLPDEKGDFLLALGNSGSKLALPTIDKFLEDKNPLLRESAIRARRAIEEANR
jgi:hypothetical protein